MQTNIRTILDYIGYGIMIASAVTLLIGFFVWFKGILPALIRLGNGFAKRKIAIFAKADNFDSLNDLLLDSKLFDKKNIIRISSENDLGKAEQTTLYLVFWHDWLDSIDEILRTKKDSTALIIYAPQDLGLIPSNKMKDLNSKRNTMITNFRGRLLNDITMSMITTSYRR